MLQEWVCWTFSPCDQSEGGARRGYRQDLYRATGGRTCRCLHLQTGCTHLLLCGCAYLRGLAWRIRPACVCMCVRVCHLLQGRAETPSVSASEPLHGHWTQTLCSHRVRSSRHTAVRADWSMSSPFQGVKVLSEKGSVCVCYLYVRQLVCVVERHSILVKDIDDFSTFRFI